MRTLQFFTDAYLEQCKALSTIEIVQFLEEFRYLHADKADAENQRFADAFVQTFESSASQGELGCN